LEKGLNHASRIGEPTTLGWIEYLYGCFRHLKGDWKAAAEHLRKSITYNEEAKFLFVLSWGWGLLGNACAYLGDPETGRSYGEKGVKMQEDAGIEMFLGWQRMYLSDTYLQVGDLENARVCAQESLRLSQKSDESYYEAIGRIFLGRILGRLESPNIGNAEECIFQGMKVLDEMKAKPFCARAHLFLGELYASASQKDKALENLMKAEAMFQEMGMHYWLAETRKVSAEL